MSQYICSAVDSPELAPVLTACWLDQMLAKFNDAPVPRLWPGTKAEARRLASAYADSVDEAERLATQVQRIAIGAWSHLINVRCADRVTEVEFRGRVGPAGEYVEIELDISEL